MLLSFQDDQLVRFSEADSLDARNSQSVSEFGDCASPKDQPGEFCYHVQAIRLHRDSFNHERR